MLGAYITSISHFQEILKQYSQNLLRKNPRLSHSFTEKDVLNAKISQKFFKTKLKCLRNLWEIDFQKRIHALAWTHFVRFRFAKIRKNFSARTAGQYALEKYGKMKTKNQKKILVRGYSRPK